MSPGFPCCCDTAGCRCFDVDGLIDCDMEVTLAGVESTVPVDCPDCDDFNDVFIASKTGGSGPFAPCTWIFSFLDDIGHRVCAVSHIEVIVRFVGPNYWAECHVIDGATSYLIYKKDLGATKPTAADLVDLDLPFFFDRHDILGWGADGDCIGSNGTCRINPI